MKKTEVAVKLTKKNCKKVLGVLEMFGERVWKYSRLNEGRFDGQYAFAMIEDCGKEWLISSTPDGKEVITTRELRNILAKEHIIKGDVVVYEVGHRWLARVDRIEGDRIYLSKTMCLSDNWVYEGGFELLSSLNFLRYATDEEKALLEPKKEFGIDEFEVGKWYVSQAGCLVNFQENNKSFGWEKSGDWQTSNWGMSDTGWYRKATEAEVIEALKKECVKRYGEEWENVKIKAHADGGGGFLNTGIYAVRVNAVEVSCINGWLFYNGNWAEPMPATDAIKTTRTISKIEIAEFIGIPVEQLEIID